ncbi:hypothetical protein BJY52DRAFT_529930 [Lactarius psammicola]|nr:hypothetical protein BJY52DRAFT_529930 [Lactarius psammicola]
MVAAVAYLNMIGLQTRPQHTLWQPPMSFLSVEPQPRVLLENFTKSLLAQFDTQLDIVADRYLPFFQERRNIEATYIESLRKLHRNAKAVDASFDPLSEPTTTRAAWDTVRDLLEKGIHLRILNCGSEPTAIAEANTQQAFLDILDNNIVKPLGTLKKSNDETRRRIEKDLKGSAVEYANFAQNKISKLQEAYLKKYHPR